MASSTSRSDIDEDRFFFGRITSEEADEILIKGKSVENLKLFQLRYITMYLSHSE